ncbi:MAG: chalcone isomerase family protein [Congregibacter sp.]
MRRSKLRAALLYFAALTISISPVQATTAIQVTPSERNAELLNESPPEATPGTQSRSATLKKVGEARLKVLLWAVYDASLFSPSGVYSENERPLRLEIQYRMGVKSTSLVERTRKEWDAMGRTHPRQNEWLDRLAAVWPDIQEDDVLALELDINNVTTFLYNGDPIGTIDDPEFGQQFIDIWASEDCTRPEMRLALIGKTR